MNHVLDTTVIFGTTIAAAAASMMLDATTAAGLDQQLQEMHLFLLPLIGALIFSGGAIMLNPAPETRRIVMGRAAISLAMGATLPSILGLLHPAVEATLIHPSVLFLLGGLIGMLCYTISRPFFARLYDRSGALADHLEQHVEVTIDRFTSKTVETKNQEPGTKNAAP